MSNQVVSAESEHIVHLWNGQATSIACSIDHHWAKPMFVTAGDTVDVWDYNRSAPLSSFEWGCERVITARFNPAEPALIALGAQPQVRLP